MKKRPLRRFYKANKYLAVQSIGWGIFAFLIILILLDDMIAAGSVLDFSFKTSVGLLMLSLLIIALGDVMALLSHHRRVRPIEPVAKAIPMPLTLLYLIVMFSHFRDGDDILLEVIVFIAFAVCVFNIKWICDRLTMNREVVTCAEMKELERRADEAGLPYLEMMENAGTEAFGYICEEEYDWLDGMLVFCGSGNNGGDGFVIARKATEYGCPATVILPCGEPKTPDAITNYRLIKDVVEVLIPDEDTDLTELLDPKGKVIVDSIFGTGFHGDPRGASKNAIKYINDLRHTNMIYAIDVPSGLPGDDGPGGPVNGGDSGNGDESHSPGGQDTPGNSDSNRRRPKFYEAVYADCVISFHARKPIHLNREPNISDHMRKTIVADIGITRALDPTLE